MKTQDGINKEDYPIMGVFEGKEHILPLRVYYEDTDFTGFVFHANYLRYFERGRTDFLRLLGGEHTWLLKENPPLAFVVTKMEIEYKAPARVDDVLKVRTQLHYARGARFMFTQRVERDGICLAHADIVIACVDLKGRPRRIPKMLEEKLEKMFNLLS